VAPQGPANGKTLEPAIEDETTSLPLLVRELARLYLEQIDHLSRKIEALGAAISREAAGGAVTRRRQTLPGAGPITALAIATFAPPMEAFHCGRDFAAWLGLVPVRRTGGKRVLGTTSKMGRRDIRRVLIGGAMTVVRFACRKGAPEGSWLHRMLCRKPRMPVARARQQNGPVHLGHAHEGRGFSGSRGRGGLIERSDFAGKERCACEEVGER
jgi:transposase